MADLYHGSAHVRCPGMDRASHATIWQYAKQEGFATSTRDVDLAEIATFGGAPPVVVWSRGGNGPTAAVGAALRAGYEGILGAEKDGTAITEVWC